jgi:hypothetical protein
MHSYCWWCSVQPGTQRPTVNTALLARTALCTDAKTHTVSMIKVSQSRGPKIRPKDMDCLGHVRR